MYRVYTMYRIYTMFRVFLFFLISNKPNNGTFRATYPDGSLVSITNPERHVFFFNLYGSYAW